MMYICSVIIKTNTDMETKEIKIGFGTINGKKVWTVCDKNNKGLTIARSHDKSDIDRKLPHTDTTEEYFYMVAKFMSKVYFAMMQDNGVAVEDRRQYTFNCENQIYKSTIK